MCMFIEFVYELVLYLFLHVVDFSDSWSQRVQISEVPLYLFIMQFYLTYVGHDYANHTFSFLQKIVFKETNDDSIIYRQLVFIVYH